MSLWFLWRPEWNQQLHEKAHFCFPGFFADRRLVTGLDRCLLQTLGCGFCANKQLCFRCLCVCTGQGVEWGDGSQQNTLPANFHPIFPWTWIKDGSYGTPTVMWPAHIQDRISWPVSTLFSGELDKALCGYTGVYFSGGSLAGGWFPE